VSDERRIRCRLCSWSVPKGPTCETVDYAFKALSNHIGYEHTELDEMLDELREIEMEEEAAYIQSLHLDRPGL
jgi:hypothetical protein